MARAGAILTSNDIDTFVAKLRATVAAAEAGDELRALAARLTGVRAPAAPRSTEPREPRGRGKGKGRRTRRTAINPEKVFAVLQGEKEGISVGELSSRLNEDKPRVAAALRKLRAGKKAKIKGEKRLARWYPM